MTPLCWRLSPDVRSVCCTMLLTKSLNLHVLGGMELNPKKCKEMVISFLKYSLPSDNAIYVSGLPVERVTSFKLLGLMISDDLSWNCHVDYVIKKANSRLYALRLLKKAGLNHSELSQHLLLVH